MSMYHFVLLYWNSNATQNTLTHYNYIWFEDIWTEVVFFILKTQHRLQSVSNQKSVDIFLQDYQSTRLIINEFSKMTFNNL